MYSNVYGERSVEVKKGWLFRQTVSLILDDHEVEMVKDAIRRRRRSSSEPA